MTYHVARPAQLWCRSNDLADRAWPANILKAKVPFDDGAVFHPHDHSALQSQTIRVIALSDVVQRDVERAAAQFRAAPLACRAEPETAAAFQGFKRCWSI